jgi:hypothetical protein
MSLLQILHFNFPQLVVPTWNVDDATIHDHMCIPNLTQPNFLRSDIFCMYLITRE